MGSSGKRAITGRALFVNFSSIFLIRRDTRIETKNRRFIADIRREWKVYRGAKRCYRFGLLLIPTRECVRADKEYEEIGKSSLSFLTGCTVTERAIGTFAGSSCQIAQRRGRVA